MTNMVKGRSTWNIRSCQPISLSYRQDAPAIFASASCPLNGYVRARHGHDDGGEDRMQRHGPGMPSAMKTHAVRVCLYGERSLP